MTSKIVLALDKSVRHTTVEGHLYIESSPISKACVSPYFGKEIPNGDVLGLDPEKLYNLYRDPVELAKGADTFRGVPILFIHKPVAADDHPKELTVGAVGTEVTFNAPYLEAPLRIWTEEAIAGIDTKTQTEISSGYRYIADMTPGEVDGVAYDGVMRNIQGNHIALVEVGRAGPDVVVQDEKPLQLRTPKMSTKKQHLSRTAIAVNGALRAYLTPKLAQDAAIGSLGALLVDVKRATLSTLKPELVKRVKAHMAGKLAADANLDDIDAAMDASDDEEIAEDDDEDDEGAPKKPKAAADVDADTEPKVTKAAMDAALDTQRKEMRAEAAALAQARKDVASIVGEVALDSAEDVYRFALDHVGVDCKDVHPSALRHMVKLAAEKKPVSVVAMDASSVVETAKQFPNLSRFNRV